MLPGDNIVYACPSCTQKTWVPSLLSGNTFESRLFSDGKRIAPMLPEFPDITRCTSCKKIFWLNEQNEVEDEHLPIFMETDLPEATFLDAFGYDEAIMEGLVHGHDEEIYIRQRIHWAINDRLRQGLPHFADYEMRTLWEWTSITI